MLVLNDSTSLSSSMNVNALNNTIQAWVMQLKSLSLGMLELGDPWSLSSLHRPGSLSAGWKELPPSVHRCHNIPSNWGKAIHFNTDCILLTFPTTYHIHNCPLNPKGAKGCWNVCPALSDVISTENHAHFLNGCLYSLLHWEKCTSILLENTTNAIFPVQSNQQCLYCSTTVLS